MSDATVADSQMLYGALDARDDRQAEFVAGGPALAIEDVLAERARNDSMATLSPAFPDSSYGSGQAVSGQSAHVGPERN